MKMKIKLSKTNALFAIAALLFMIEASSLSSFGIFSPLTVLITTAFGIVFAVYATLYLLHYGRPKRYAWAERYFNGLFITIAAIFAIQVSLLLINLKTAYLSVLLQPGLLFLNIPFMMPIILFLFFSRRLSILKTSARYRRRIKILAMVMLIAAIAFILIESFAPPFHGALALDDEEFTGIMSAQAFISGQNPYLLSFAPQMYNYAVNGHPGIGLTTYTNNSFVSVLVYPALYFLINVPFMLLPGHLINLPYGGIGIYAPLFTLLLYFVVSYIIRPDLLKRPPPIIIAFLILATAVYSSFINTLLLTLMLLAFYFIDSKYVWVLLGIAASFQQMLWVPAILFAVYSFRSHGIRRGASNILGIAVIFLAINGYFIIANPHAFLSNVLVPSSGSILPNSTAIFGYPVLYIYHTLLNPATVLFLASIAGVIILYAYFNEKYLIFFFSLVPLLFLYRSIIPYLNFFMPLTVISLYIANRKTGSKSPRRDRSLSRHITAYRAATISVLSILVILSAIPVYQSHIQYGKAGISVGAVKVQQESNTIVYNFSIYYSNPITRNVSIFVFYNSHGKLQQLFHGEHNITATPPFAVQKSQIANSINPDFLLLNSSSGRINVSASIPSNSVASVSKVVCELYSGDFYYFCPVATVK